MISSTETRFDPATEPPAHGRPKANGEHRTERGSRWFFAGAASVIMVFSVVWGIYVLVPALQERNAASDSSPRMSVDRAMTTSSIDEE